MTLRLNGSNSGFTEVKAPATAGSNTITLPTSNGSANQYLANGSTAGELTFVTPPGSFTSYAIISDEKANNTHAGTFTQDAWQTRDLNNEITDPDAIVSITNNQFELIPGSYLVEGSAPAIEVSRHQVRLYDVTNSAVVEYGTSEYSSGSNSYATTNSRVSARVVISSATTYELQHRCQVTKTNFGLGLSTNFGGVEVYSVVKIYKEA